MHISKELETNSEMPVNAAALNVLGNDEGVEELQSAPHSQENEDHGDERELSIHTLHGCRHGLAQEMVSPGFSGLQYIGMQ